MFLVTQLNGQLAPGSIVSVSSADKREIGVISFSVCYSVGRICKEAMHRVATLPHCGIATLTLHAARQSITAMLYQI